MRIQALPLVARRILQPPKSQAHFSSMADTEQPRFSEGENGGRMMAETAALLESKWALDETQQGLEKTFNFPTYAKALVSHPQPHRALAEVYGGFHTPHWRGDQIAKSPP